MNWFKDHGDKLFAGIATTAAGLTQAGVIPAQYVAVTGGVLALLHTLFWPNNPSTGSNQQ